MQASLNERTATPPRRLFRKYLALFLSVICVALVSNASVDLYFLLRDHRTLLALNLSSQAETATARIEQFVRDVHRPITWAIQLSRTGDTLDDWQFYAALLFRQVPAITGFTRLDGSGREMLHTSRIAPTVLGSGIDFSRDPGFTGALAAPVHYGPVYFLRETEPYMALAIADFDGGAGVSIVEVNLSFIRDVVSQIKIGKRGRALIVDARGHLIAHPDISLVLRNLDLSHVEQVREALSPGSTQPERPLFSLDLEGQKVLAVHASIMPPGWHLFVELPADEVNAPLYEAMARSTALLLGVLAFSILAGLIVTRRMMAPIEALHTGVARIGSGDLSQRLSIRTGDELEALGDQFNAMAARLEESYASLEQQVEQRTHQLELANLAKSRFLAVASHDLRQPLHALGLFIAELPAHVHTPEGRRIVGRIDVAVAALNEMLNSLLDISRLDAGAYLPTVGRFPVERVLGRIEATFAAAAAEKKLSLTIVPSKAWVQSDAVKLERILLNLVSNALQYTVRGGVVVGCRRRGSRLRIEVWDSGPGIAEGERQKIFSEFYPLVAPGGERRTGLGLGLAIVNRLCTILDHPIELTSAVGTGSRFAITVPMTAEGPSADIAQQASAEADIARGRLVVVVEDDPLVAEAMCGVLQGWGLRVATGRGEGDALAAVDREGQPPNLVISDYQLLDGKTGIDVIDAVRRKWGRQIPAFLISGFMSPELLRHASSSGLHLLHKPVPPMRLRAIVSQLLRERSTEESAAPPAL